jgi:hypothetical protein
MALCSTSTALYPLYGPLFPQQPSVLSTALCLLCNSFPLYDHLSPLGPSVLSTALCPHWGPLSSLRPSVSSTALCPLHGPLFSLRPSVPSTALCPLYGPLSPLRPSVPSKTQRNKRNDPLVSQNVLQKVFLKNSKGYRDLFRVSDNRDYRDNHDYHSSEMLSDNREIAIIALAKKDLR